MQLPWVFFKIPATAENIPAIITARTLFTNYQKYEAKMTEEKRKPPVYIGMRKYWDHEAGYAVWLSSDWRQIDMVKGRQGWIFTPYKDNYDTCFLSEKKMLKYPVEPKDADTLMQGLLEGINSLPDAVILETKKDTGVKVVLVEAKYTFTENGQRRKRWVKSMYWGNSNLVLVAQGATEEDYAYWEGMLFNAMTTYEINWRRWKTAASLRLNSSRNYRLSCVRTAPRKSIKSPGPDTAPMPAPA
jgi:hypothetical protein